MGAAMLRAAHQVGGEPVIFADPFALAILGESAAQHIRATVDEQPPARRVMRAFMAARSRFAEDQLAAAIGRGTRRYVVLGAGLDTFAYRNPFAAEGLQVFEIDHPMTQAWKQARLAAAGIVIPPSVTYVPINFETDRLAEVLAANGIGRDKPVFFSWLGVVPYLTQDAIFETLALIGDWPAPSGVVFDYSQPPEQMPPWQRASYKRRAARVAELGEPWITSFDPASLAESLRGFGFNELVDWSGPEIDAAYFRGSVPYLKMATSGHVTAALNL